MFELFHYLDLLEFAWRKAVEIDSLDLLDRDESFSLAVVAAVDGAK